MIILEPRPRLFFFLLVTSCVRLILIPHDSCTHEILFPFVKRTIMLVEEASVSMSALCQLTHRNGPAHITSTPCWVILICLFIISRLLTQYSWPSFHNLLPKPK